MQFSGLTNENPKPAEDDVVMSREAADLFATIIAANVDEAASINRRILSGLEAERDTWMDRCWKILNQLEAIPWHSRTMPVQTILDNWLDLTAEALERRERLPQ